MGCSDKSSHAEHQSKTNKPIQNRTEHKIDKVFHQYIRSIFCTGKSGFDQSKSRLHPKYQHSRQQHPNRIKRRRQIGNIIHRSRNSVRLCIYNCLRTKSYRCRIGLYSSCILRPYPNKTIK